MTYERRKIIRGKTTAVTGDRDRDNLISALCALESREGERKGWDRPPGVFTAHLPDPDVDVVELRVIPHRVWSYGLPSPVDDLVRSALATPEPHPDARQLAYQDSPDGVSAVVFLSEGWMVAEDSLTPEQRAMRATGRRILHELPQRIETRSAVAVDINGYGYDVLRCRGEGQRPPRLIDRAEMWKPPNAGPGILPRALHRLAYAARLGVWPPR